MATCTLIKLFFGWKTLECYRSKCKGCFRMRFCCEIAFTSLFGANNLIQSNFLSNWEFHYSFLLVLLLCDWVFSVRRWILESRKVISHRKLHRRLPSIHWQCLMRFHLFGAYPHINTIDAIIHKKPTSLYLEYCSSLLSINDRWD